MSLLGLFRLRCPISKFVAVLMNQADVTTVCAAHVAGVTLTIADYRWKARTQSTFFRPHLVVGRRIQPFALKGYGSLPRQRFLNLGVLTVRNAFVETVIQGAEEDQASRSMTCQFDQEWVRSVVSDEGIGRILDFRSSLDIYHKDVDYLMCRLTREVESPGFASAILIESLCRAIAVELTTLAQDEKPHYKRAAGSLSASAVGKVQEIVDSVGVRQLKVADLARECGTSVTSLRQMFKESTGETLHSFIAQRRIQRAKAMLLTDAPLKTISYELGFCNPAAFSTAFRKAAGASPREYRRRSITRAAA